MSTHSQEEFADDFEIVILPPKQGQPGETQSASTFPSSKECGDPYCQLSHISPEEENKSNRAIEPLLAIMKATAESITAGPLFHMSKSPAEQDMVAKAFVDGIPIENRRVVNCHACKKFMRQYGDLCIVADDGSLVPLAWPTDVENVPQYYKKPAENILKLFQGRSVSEEFVLGSEKGRVLGTPSSPGGWNHMSVELPKFPLGRSNSSMSSQNTATSFTMLDRILNDNTPEAIARTHHLLVQDQLPYATAHKAFITYLQETSIKLAAQNTKDEVKRRNLITRYARAAFPGCISSLRGGMIGFLLECVTKEQDFETLKENWQRKTNPITYLRPVAIPSVKNIESAEKIFARLGYSPHDLERVFLTLDQVPKSGVLWSPSSVGPIVSTVAAAFVPEDTPTPQKLFNSLLPNISSGNVSYGDAPLQKCTFRKFVLKILPTASNMAVLPASEIRPFFLTTGKEGSKPIMSFHREGSHTASWYTWITPRSPQYATMKQEWTPVQAVLSFPHMWDEFASAVDALDDVKSEEFRFMRLGIKYLICVEGAREIRGTKRGLGFFPNMIRGDFNAVRKTVEAFSNEGNIQEPQGKGHVVGFSVNKSTGAKDLIIGVKTKTGQVSRYQIDMFD